MSRPALGWFERLPADRLLVEISLWSGNLGRLAEDMARIDHLTDIYHIDVADGHFAPTMLFFPDLVACIRKLSMKPFHIHLMATDAILLAQIQQFAEAGADVISIHAENGGVSHALSLIQRLERVAGLVLQLQTPVSAAIPYLDSIKVLTLLGTPIGVKGQGLDPRAEPRLREAQHLLARRGGEQRTILAADGGIREHTVAGLRLAGAEAIVMGSLAFSAPDPAKRIAWVHTLPVGTHVSE
jgi:ribulose-phosphate 3-epimerase